MFAPLFCLVSLVYWPVLHCQKHKSIDGCMSTAHSPGGRLLDLFSVFVNRNLEVIPTLSSTLLPVTGPAEVQATVD